MFELEPEHWIVLRAVLIVFFVLVVLERVIPARKAADGIRSVRNFALQGLNVAMLFLLPATLVGASLWALFNQFGLFNQVTMGLWTRIILGLVLLDLSMYWLHRAYHGVALLWRFHRIHHSDRALDITTAFRTHPVETLLTFSVRASVIIALGLPLIGVVLYETIVAVMAMFLHSNIRLARQIDWFLGWLVMTPALHRLHHDVDSKLRSSNYGLVLSVWDRLFGTLKNQQCRLSESAGESSIGLGERSNEGFGSLLVSPFAGRLTRQ